MEVSARAAELVRRMTAGQAGAPRPVSVPEPSVRDGRARIVAPTALGAGVRIIGDLNHWQPEGVPLAPLPGLPPELVGIDVPLLGPLRYRLVIDGRSMLDPANPRVVDGPDGQPANLVSTSTEMATEPPGLASPRVGFPGTP